ncbi:metallophosphoesterase family protein [Parabacteroides pacaensis]|uniref:metallophosphoesterase family protein n=1 Tax=Parabacteroides pacaensis TaxID=2086575 RepID=UPI000D113D81|nr:metallophosphoesterase family protein [Parabacteroides pacaensis]
MRALLLCISILLECMYWGDAKAQSNTLRFNADKKFKIVQFTDVHYIYGNPKSDISLERIKEVVDAEKPDLVIFTGDVIYGKPAEKGLRTVLNLVSERKVPFAVTFGNHDNEQGLTRTQLFEIIKTIPYNVTDTTPGISGVTNFILPVKSSDGRKDAAILYCIDSHSYSSIDGVGGYDYIKFDQIDWYRMNSQKYTRQNGGNPVPSMAFFHIALPEFNQAASDETAILTGTRKEKACAPQLNSGLFTSMKEMGDIMGVFVGHDHDDDYAVYWKGILLAYGRYTGGNTVYNNLPNGARVIEMTEGERFFTTWIRLKEGEIVHKVTYPTDFIKKKD